MSECVPKRSGKNCTKKLAQNFASIIFVWDDILQILLYLSGMPGNSWKYHCRRLSLGTVSKIEACFDLWKLALSVLITTHQVTRKYSWKFGTLVLVDDYSRRFCFILYVRKCTIKWFPISYIIYGNQIGHSKMTVIEISKGLTQKEPVHEGEGTSMDEFFWCWND